MSRPSSTHPLRPQVSHLGGFDNEYSFGAFATWAMKKKPGRLGYIGDEILPSYIGIIINHYKDPY